MIERSILLVEDSEAIRTAFTILLEDAGYRVMGAGMGGEALRMAGEHAPDLVLLDMGLPDMSGLDVVRRLKANPATVDIPVVALTGRDEDADRQACLAAGCAAYLVKPVDTQRLVRDLPGFMTASPAA
ncbi:response regulator transcription factor [Longimicrobium sp.]|uniref:response regulator transcription factor n=1 Tax=Longimicrobium sp. TaxID=2029185 RepID=UPI002EDA44C1